MHQSTIYTAAPHIKRKHGIFTIVPSHHRIPGVHGRSSLVRRPSGTPTRHRDQYVQTAQACSCKNMYRAACSSQATICLQLQIAAATVPAWPYHSGRTLIRLGRAASRSFLISAGVTRQDSRDRERRFCSSVRWWRPELDTRELDTLSDTSAVRPTVRRESTSVLINACCKNN